MTIPFLIGLGLLVLLGYAGIHRDRVMSGPSGSDDTSRLDECWYLPAALRRGAG
jgi:hypothetical protein